MLKENWVFVWKMAWGIWWVLTQAVESLKTNILMGYSYWNYEIFELKEYGRVL